MYRYGVILSLVAAAVHAADAESAIRATFVKAWIEAVRSGDEAKVKGLFHPKVLTCSNDQTREYFDYLFAAELKYRARSNYRVSQIAPLKGPAPLLMLPADGFSYPVQPAYEIDIEAGNTTIIRYLAESKGSWFEVQPCPNEKGMAFLHEQLAKGKQQKEHATRLLEELRDPLRSELITLLKQERKIEAVRKYQAATGEDVTTAVAVMDLLNPRQ